MLFVQDFLALYQTTESANTEPEIKTPPFGGFSFS
jgi:hypothetical protein